MAKFEIIGTYCCGTKEITQIDSIVSADSDDAVRDELVRVIWSLAVQYGSRPFAQYILNGRRKNIERVAKILTDNNLGEFMMSPVAWMGEKKPKKSLVTLVYTPNASALRKAAGKDKAERAAVARA